jgi:Rad3-related DNA helicase
MSEGIDLPDDLARINIIPKLQYPYLKDPYVVKRMALQDGEKWYALEALKYAIQAAGRTTRHEKDWSTTIIMDPTFKRKVDEYHDELPKDFTDAIVW